MTANNQHKPLNPMQARINIPQLNAWMGKRRINYFGHACTACSLKLSAGPLLDSSA